MIRFRCNQCGKIVEYLRKYHKDAKQSRCSCGGKLLPVNANSNENMEELKGLLNEKSRDGNHHP
ncbi:hypothetical protein [Desulfotomaculum sp. 1211_IL3151]|uniref:hypothetical protein n=1 Tax=Desulfotomaculum sp. 1211_IL3151 TaxID=3084055 RepID=UPI002FD8ABBF